MLQNITGKLLASWYELLNGFVPGVNIYRSDVASSETNHHIILRPESETTASNNQKHVTNVVIITEVVAIFTTAIDDQIAIDIDRQIASLLFQSGPGLHSLPAQDDIEISTVIRQNSTYLQEDDGVRRYNRIITRNVHRVVQLSEAS